MRSLTLALSSLLLLQLGCSDASDNQGDTSKMSPDAGDTLKSIQAPKSSQWLPLEPDQQYAGKSLSEWSIEWMRWSFSQTTCDSSTFDSDGSLCRLYQEDANNPVFFMAYAPADEPRTRCTIPRGRAVLVPLMNFFADDADGTTMRTLAELKDTAQGVLDSMRDLKLRADGEDIGDLARYILPPTQYTYNVPAAPNWYSCNGIDGVEDKVIDPAVVSGYFVLFPPPELGTHELDYGGVVTSDGEDYSLRMDYRFEVVDD